MVDRTGTQGRWRVVGRRIAIGLVAATVGALGLGLGSWLGWHAAGPLPTTAHATAVVETEFEGAAIQTVSRDDRLFTYSYPPDNDRWVVKVFGSEDYDPGYVSFYATTSKSAAMFLADATVKLAADGWYVRQDSIYGVVAQRDGIALRVSASDVASADTADVDIVFERPEPAAAWWLGVAGWLVATLAGLLLARWIWYADVIPARVAMTCGAIVMAPFTILTTLGFPARQLFAPDLLPPSPAWGGYMEILRAFPALGSVAIVGALLAATISRLFLSRRRSIADASRPDDALIADVQAAPVGSAALNGSDEI